MTIEAYRKKIDSIDTRVVDLLNARARLSQKIGQEKLKHNKGIYSPDREYKLLKRIKQLNTGPLPNDALEAVYREIMSGSLSLEKKDTKVAVLGTEGSFTYTAARKTFGSQVQYVPCESIPEVFNTVEIGNCDYGFVPIENSTEGSVTYTMDLLVDSDLKICKQRFMKISHALLSNVSLNKIKKIYSNPNALGQCRHWLQQNLPGAAHLWVASTTEAAKLVAKSRDAAAIASVEAAKLAGVKILRRDIQDVIHNTTRFLVIAWQDVPPTGNDRTSILFSIKDRVGALYAMLTPFTRNKINMTKIESRPSKRRAWDYFFFVDFEGHREDRHVKRALSQLEDMCKYLKILGSYPAT